MQAVSRWQQAARRPDPESFTVRTDVELASSQWLCWGSESGFSCTAEPGLEEGDTSGLQAGRRLNTYDAGPDWRIWPCALGGDFMGFHLARRLYGVAELTGYFP